MIAALYKKVPAGLWPPLLVLLAWEIGAHLAAGRGSAFVVPLEKVAAAAADLLVQGVLQVDLGWTLWRVASGFALGACAGLAFGALTGASGLAERLAGPLFHALRQIPFTGLVPLCALFLGVGSSAQIGLVTIAVFYPVALNTAEGLRAVPGSYRELGRSLNFSRFQQWRRIMLPGALPQIFTGLKHGLAFAWIAAVAAELLITAGPGLGALIESGTTIRGFEVSVVGIAVIGACGYGMSLAVAGLEARLLRWRGMKG